MSVWLNLWPCGDHFVTIIWLWITSTVCLWIGLENVGASSGSVGDQTLELLFFFPHSLTSSVPHVFALSLNERLNLLPLPQSIPPAVSTPTLASLHTDPAGHNDDKSAQIFMSIEIHFGSAHSSLSVLSFFFFYASLFIGHRTCSQTIIITLLKTPQARYIT